MNLPGGNARRKTGAVVSALVRKVVRQPSGQSHSPRAAIPARHPAGVGMKGGEQGFESPTTRFEMPLRRDLRGDVGNQIPLGMGCGGRKVQMEVAVAGAEHTLDVTLDRDA